MKKQALWFSCLLCFIVICLVMFSRLSSNRGMRQSTVHMVAMALRIYTTTHGVGPYEKGADAQDLWLRLLGSDGTPEDVSAFHIVNRSPDDWRILQRCGIGKTVSLGMIGNWPYAWCRNGRKAEEWTVISGGNFTPEHMSTEALNRANRYARLLLTRSETPPDFSKSDFFQWGFQRKVEPIIRRGLLNLAQSKRNTLGMIMVPIPGGRYVRGITQEVADRIHEESGVIRKYLTDRMPKHEVSVDPFWASFALVTEKARDEFLSSQQSQTSHEDVRGFTWREANAFCEWLTNREQALGKIDAKEVYRLPTEAEWEWMMLGGDEGPYPWGTHYPEKDDEGLYPYSLINRYGLIAWCWSKEYCIDIYSSTYYRRSARNNPVNLTADEAERKPQRVIRGGNWGSRWSKSGQPSYLSRRGGACDNTVFGNVSFRIVLTRPVTQNSTASAQKISPRVGSERMSNDNQ